MDIFLTHFSPSDRTTQIAMVTPGPKGAVNITQKDCFLRLKLVENVRKAEKQDVVSLKTNKRSEKTDNMAELAQTEVINGHAT